MDVKAFLDELDVLQSQIRRTRLELHLRAMEAVRRTDAIIDRLEDLEQIHAGRVSCLIEGIVSLKHPKVAMIMGLRYIDGKSWEEIEDLTELSRSQIFRLHKQGLEILESSMTLQS